MTELATDNRGVPISSRIGFWAGLIPLLLVWLLPAPGDMSQDAWMTAGMMMLMAIWWATEALPIPATALVPIVLIPAFGIGTIGQATSPYANPVIFLFLGGFMLGMSMQRWNLHKRIALWVLIAVGSNPRRQIAGVMFATAFIGMWVSNTATAIMMLPIGMSIIAMTKSDNEEDLARFSRALMLCIAYAASAGGIATLIGTPPNALLAGYLLETHGIQVGFAQWMVVGLPISIGMQIFIWAWLTRGGFKLGDSSATGDMLRQQLAELGPLSTGEKRTAMIGVLMALAWILQPVLKTWMPWLSDALIAIAGSLLMFLTPVNKAKREFVMDWNATRDMPWGILVLFGGGLSLAAVITRSGLSEWIAGSFDGIGVLPALLLVGVVVASINLLTEITSNTATAATFLPLMGALAVSMGVSPVLLAIPTALAASCAFMMPVATPPNAIVFASGHLKISHMIQNGFAITLFSIVTITLLGYFLVGVAFSL